MVTGELVCICIAGGRFTEIIRVTGGEFGHIGASTGETIITGDLGGSGEDIGELVVISTG